MGSQISGHLNYKETNYCSPKPAIYLLSIIRYLCITRINESIIANHFHFFAHFVPIKGFKVLEK